MEIHDDETLLGNYHSIPAGGREWGGGGCKNRLPADKKQKINEQSLISTPNKIEGENIPRSSLFIHKKVAGIFEFWSFTSTRSVPHTATHFGMLYVFTVYDNDEGKKKYNLRSGKF